MRQNKGGYKKKIDAQLQDQQTGDKEPDSDNAGKPRNEQSPSNDHLPKPSDVPCSDFPTPRKHDYNRNSTVLDRL